MQVVILDRDGVINYDSPTYIKSPDEWHPIPGSLAAIAQLNRAGFRVFVATNQSGLARGLYDEATLQAIHKKLHAALQEVDGNIEAIAYCPHHPDDHCACRKPLPGLLQQIKDNYQIDLAKAIFIGDSIGDIKAARAAGCEPILVLTGNGEKTLAQYPEAKAIRHFADLAQAANSLCQNR